MTRKTIESLAAALALIIAAASSPALAEQEEPEMIPDVDSAFKGDYLIVGMGGIYVPDHEGSNDYKIAPAAGFRGRVGDIRVFSRSIGIGADLLPDRKGADVNFTLGPVVRYRANRGGNVKDPVVALLPELKSTVEAGVTLGVSFQGVVMQRDSLSVSSDVRWGVTGNKNSRIITTSISYFTPVSRAAGVGLSFGMDHVNDRYADYNYSVDAAGSAASGLPVFRARGGWKNMGGRLYAGYDLDGDLLNGGWGVGAAVSYLRLRGSAAHTPITALRGSRSQWMMGVGLGYTF